MSLTNKKKSRKHLTWDEGPERFNMYRGGQNYNSESLQPSVEHGGGSVVVFKIDGIINTDVPSDFDPSCKTIWKVSYWQ